MKIAVIGTGNLSWHLCHVLCSAHEVVAVSRAGKAEWPVPVLPYDTLPGEELNFVLLAVPDEALAAVGARLTTLLSARTPVAHLSGASPLAILPEYFVHRAVVWPVYSFRSGSEPIPWSNIPLVLAASFRGQPVALEELNEKTPNDLPVSYVEEGSRGTIRRVLWEILKAMDGPRTALNDDQRAQLHLAATVVNNFGNLLAQVGYEITHRAAVPFAFLRPILRQTVDRLTDQAPIGLQTGAAARGDEATMARHLSALGTEEERRMYELLSAMITRRVAH